MLINLSPKSSFLIRLALVALALTALPATVAQAETISVSTQDDSLDAAGGVCGDMTPKNIATTGDGLVSLREAVCAANNTPDADTIFLPTGTYTLILIGHSDDDNLTGDLDIKADGGDLIIYHEGPGQAIISGVGAAVPGDRVLHIDPTWIGGITVTISGVTVQNGGYILGSGPGGGLLIMGDNTVNITDCAIKHNRVVTAAGSGGGGIYNDGATINITDTTISFNEVIAAANYARGGGIYNTSGGTVNLTSSTIYSNTVSVVYGSECEAYGGGIYSWFSPVNVTDSTISENRAITSGSGGYCGRGGGIYSYDARISLSGQTHLTGNTADYEGGGFYNYKGTLTVNDTTISDNEAGYIGGGLFDEEGEATLERSTVSNNDAIEDYGGGIYLMSSSIVLTDTFVVGNTSGFEGGGIFAGGSTISLSGGIVTGNAADDDGGGISLNHSSATLSSMAVASNLARGDGGGIYLDTGSADLTDMNLVRNNAQGDGGGIYVSDSTANLSRVAVVLNASGFEGDGSGDGGGIYSVDGSSAVTVTNSLIYSNTVGSLGVGGGILSGDGIMIIANSTLSGNEADFGGGIFIDESSTYLSHVTTTDNTADKNDNGVGYGGGIYCDTDGHVYLKGNIVAGNHHEKSASTRDCLIDGFSLSLGSNLVGSGTGCPSDGTGDQTTTDPGLGPLANNGGWPQTHALLSTSPAIDAVTGCYDLQGNPVTIDQRGQPRPFDGNLDGTALCDIGAYEFKAPTVYLPLVVREHQ